ncbi:MAG: hypothetical protein KGQ41_05605 [Alphaproteobacteria bacterium]|nr:hypothetical protein [Alphaproteobacteria bacterium]
MSLTRKLILSTVVVLLLVSLGGAAVLYISWQREQVTGGLMALLGGAHANTLNQLHVMGLTIAGLAFGSGAVVFLFMVWNSWIAIVGVAMPLGKFSETLARLSEGETKTELTKEARRKDEIGTIARAIVDLCKSREQLAADEHERRLEAEAKAKRAEALERMVRDFGGAMNDVAKTLATSASQLESSATVMDHTALRTGELAGSLMEDSQKVDSGMGVVSSAETALSGTIAEIRDKVHIARDVTGKAVTEAQESRANVATLVDEVTKIGGILTLISSIAAQTNLLALNATIEAARAGEVGKGFAVVALEVKELADQTANATADITARIKRIQEATITSSKTIEAFAETVARIGEISGEITQSVDQQKQATDAIAHSVHEAADATRAFTGNVGEVNQAAAETGQAVRDVMGAASYVAKQADSLGVLVNDFLSDVKALG